jgi:hypothetical protein
MTTTIMETEEERDEANETAGGDVVVDYTHPPQSDGGHETFSDLMDDDTRTKEESTQSIFLVFQKINLMDKMMRERERRRRRSSSSSSSVEEWKSQRTFALLGFPLGFQTKIAIRKNRERERARHTETVQRGRERDSEAARDRDQI